MRTTAIVGDIIVIAAATVLGFATHGTIGQTSRLFVTVLGFMLAWAWIAPWVGAFGNDVLTRPARIWKVFIAWTAAAPIGAVLRGAATGSSVSPVFVGVMIVVTGCGLCAWRAALAWRTSLRSVHS